MDTRKLASTTVIGHAFLIVVCVVLSGQSSLAQSNNDIPTFDVPQYCKLSVEDSRTNFRIKEVYELNSQWRAVEKGYAPKSSVDSITIDVVTEHIRQACSGENLRGQIERVVKDESYNKYHYPARCFVEPADLRELGGLSREIRTKAFTYNYDALSRCKNDWDQAQKYGFTTDCTNLSTLIDNLVASTGPACQAYFSEAHYSGLLAKIAKRDAQHATALAAAKREREAKNKATAALNAAVNKRKILIQEIEIPTSEKIVWGQESPGSGRALASDQIEWVNQVNIAYQDKRREATTTPAFVAPEKGEFEPTSDYTARVSELKRSHQKAALDAIAELERKTTETLVSSIGTVSGKPRVLRVQYDADRKIFAGAVGNGGLAVNFEV